MQAYTLLLNIGRSEDSAVHPKGVSEPINIIQYQIGLKVVAESSLFGLALAHLVVVSRRGCACASPNRPSSPVVHLRC